MLWNSLSHELRSTVSVSEFKGKLRHYSLNETPHPYNTVLFIN